MLGCDLASDMGAMNLRCWRWEGFASMRESFAFVDRVHAELKVGRGEVEWIGYGGTARRSLGDLGSASVCGVELRLSLVSAWDGAEGRWVSDPCALSSLSLSL